MFKPFRLICGLVVLAAISQATQAANDQQFHITTLSTRPDMISGGNVLIQVDVPQDIPVDSATVKLNGQDVTAALYPDASAHRLIGLVAGLKLGENVLEVFNGPKQTVRASQLILKNHPITGPIFSGSQEQPFICQTQDFVLPDGSLLGPPIDADCSVKTVVTYVYKSATRTGAAASDMGISVPNLKPFAKPDGAVARCGLDYDNDRREGSLHRACGNRTINRAIYQIAVLHDPTTERRVRWLH